jgi:biopolymer transport protein ExbB
MQRRFVLGGVGLSLASLLLFGVSLVAFSAVSLGDPQTAHAQAKEAAADAGEEAGGDEGGAKQAEGSESMLVWLYRSLGLRYVVVFLFLSFTLVALFVMNLLALRRDNIIPAALVEAFESHLNEKRYQEAYELAKNDESFLGQLLAAGLGNLSAGYDKAAAAMQEVGEEETMKMEQRLGYVALIAQIGPMFGLLGTVDGMVQAFDTIAKSSVTPKPSELAVGIGTALVTTVVGLWVAIPSITYYNIVRNRMQKLLLEVGVVSENLMSRFSTVGAGATGVKKS